MSLINQLSTQDVLLVESILEDFEQSLNNNGARACDQFFKRFARTFESKFAKAYLLKNLILIEAAHFDYRTEEKIRDVYQEICHPFGDGFLNSIVAEIRFQYVPEIPDQFGHFVPIQELGRGSMGIVYLGQNEKFPEIDHAIKTLRLDLVKNTNDADELRQFLEDEIKNQSQLSKTRQIVPLYDAGVEGDWIYYVMKFMEGGSLEKRLKSGNIRLNDVVRWFLDVSRGIAAAHEKDIIHCDLKPDNILLDEQENAYISDFGIAFQLVESDFTVLDEFRGNIMFCAPEQLSGGRVGKQSDIYSIGAIFEFILNHFVTSRREIPVSPPPELRRIVEKCKAVDLNDRYEKCDELVHDLEKFMDRKRLRTTKLIAASFAALLATLLGIYGWESWKLGIDRNIAIQQQTLSDELLDTYATTGFQLSNATMEDQQYYPPMSEANLKKLDRLIAKGSQRNSRDVLYTLDNDIARQTRKLLAASSDKEFFSLLDSASVVQSDLNSVNADPNRIDKRTQQISLIRALAALHLKKWNQAKSEFDQLEMTSEVDFQIAKAYFLAKTGNIHEAKTLYEELLSSTTELSPLFRGIIMGNQGLCETALGQFKKADKNFERAEKLLKEIDTDESKRAYCVVRINRLGLFRSVKNTNVTKESFQSLTKWIDKNRECFQTETQQLALRASANFALGDWHFQRREFKLAAETYDAIADTLIGKPAWRSMAATAKLAESDAHYLDGNFKRAIDALIRAKQWQKNDDENEDENENEFVKHFANVNLAKLLADEKGNRNAALRLTNEAIRFLKQQKINSLVYKLNLAIALSNRSVLAEDKKSCREAIKILQDDLKVDLDSPLRAQVALADVLVIQAQQTYNKNIPASPETFQNLRRAIKLLKNVEAEGHREYQFSLAYAYISHSNALSTHKKWKQAKLRTTQALEILGDLLKANPNSRRLQVTLANAQKDLAVALLCIAAANPASNNQEKTVQEAEQFLVTSDKVLKKLGCPDPDIEQLRQVIEQVFPPMAQ